MKAFLKDIWKTSLLHRFWCFLILLYNFIWPILLLNLWQAKLVAFVFVLVFVSQLIIHKKYGYKRIMAMAHMFWLPMMVYLLRNTITIEMSPLEIAWVYGMIIVNIVSLILDFKELKLWFSGDKDSSFGRPKNAQT